MRYFNDVNKIYIPEDFEQAFFKDPMLTTDLTATVMLKTKGTIDKTDIKILDFIYETKFCTKSQLDRYASYIGIDKDDLDARLAIMFANTVINKFGFVDEENYRGKMPDDITTFYCLHCGGKQLLDQFSGEDFIDWQPGYVVCHAKNVLKTIAGAEVYIQFLTAETPLVYHTKRPMYTINKGDRFWAGDAFSVSKDGVPYYYIVDTFLESDRTNMVRNKLRNYQSMFSTNIWKRYYVDGGRPPMLIFITNSDNAAVSLAAEIERNVKFPNGYLISTFDRLPLGLNNPGSLLEHNLEKHTLVNASINI